MPPDWTAALSTWRCSNRACNATSDSIVLPPGWMELVRPSGVTYCLCGQCRGLAVRVELDEPSVVSFGRS